MLGTLLSLSSGCLVVFVRCIANYKYDMTQTGSYLAKCSCIRLSTYIMQVSFLSLSFSCLCAEPYCWCPLYLAQIVYIHYIGIPTVSEIQLSMCITHSTDVNLLPSRCKHERYKKHICSISLYLFCATTRGIKSIAALFVYSSNVQTLDV